MQIFQTTVSPTPGRTPSEQLAETGETTEHADGFCVVFDNIDNQEDRPRREPFDGRDPRIYSGDTPPDIAKTGTNEGRALDGKGTDIDPKSEKMAVSEPAEQAEKTAYSLPEPLSKSPGGGDQDAPFRVVQSQKAQSQKTDQPSGERLPVVPTGQEQVASKPPVITSPSELILVQEMSVKAAPANAAMIPVREAQTTSEVSVQTTSEARVQTATFTIAPTPLTSKKSAESLVRLEPTGPLPAKPDLTGGPVSHMTTQPKLATPVDPSIPQSLPLQTKPSLEIPPLNKAHPVDLSAKTPSAAQNVARPESVVPMTAPPVIPVRPQMQKPETVERQDPAIRSAHPRATLVPEHAAPLVKTPPQTETMQRPAAQVVQPVLDWARKPVIHEEATRPSGEQTLEMRSETRITQPVSAVFQTIKPEFSQTVMRQMADAVRAKVTSDKAVEIALRPAELGRVRIAMTAADAGMIVTVQAERAETLDLMRRNIDDLARSFEHMGHENLSFNFEQSGTFDHDGEGHLGASPDQSDQPDDSPPMSGQPVPAQVLRTNQSGIDILL